MWCCELPIIKYVAVHGSPLSLLRYVTNENKTEKTLISGINCSTNSQEAYDEMKRNFELYSEERFWKKSLFMKSEILGGKERVRLHHYIQSFKAGELTAEKAHQIGMEWVKAVFGEKFQVLISTHTDKGHYHNHVIVCPYDDDGKLWRADKKSLQHCKDISDRISLAHGLSIIEHPKKSYNHKYGDYMAQRRESSWKEKLRSELDELVMRDDVRSVDDLVDRLKEKGYGIHMKKYLSIKVKPNRKAIRTYRLGDGYFLEHLAYRIEHKNFEMPLSDIAKYNGIQREYAICLRQLQMILYKSPEAERPQYVSYRSVLKSYELLCYMHEHKVHSIEDLKAEVSKAEKNYSEVLSEQKMLAEKIAEEEKIIDDFPKFKELASHKPFSAEDRNLLRQYSYLADNCVFTESDVANHRNSLAVLRGRQKSFEEKVKNAKIESDKLRDYLDTYNSQTAAQYDILLARAEEERQMMIREPKENQQEQTTEQKKRGISI